MSTALNDESQQEKAPFRHAVVIGSSIAGLMAARVLTDYFARVTIIERDRLPATPEFRRGAPQARHVHVLRLRGQQILEQQFPGLIDELLAQGATMINAGNEAEFFLFDHWRGPRYPSAIATIACSRPLLETALVRRLTAHPKITLIEGYDVDSLKVDKSSNRVAGVLLRRRGGTYPDEVHLRADLVVDASGRGSKAPEWLESLGYAPPKETIINAFPGYTTRIYRRPAGRRLGWKTMYIIPTPPNSPRGGVIAPLENDRWIVTLIGMGGDHPPTDEDGFLAFARGLPSQQLYEAIKGAEPLTKPYGFRRNENRLRHYDALPRHLEGFLVIGDGVCALNPIHAQGMTVAAMGSLALERCLQTHVHQHGKGNLAGLAKAFQQALAQVVAGTWHLSTSTDRRWPTTTGANVQLSLKTRLRQRYLTWVLRAMVINPKVAEVFFGVQHMVESPQALFRPQIMFQVLGSLLRWRRQAPVIWPEPATSFLEFN